MATAAHGEGNNQELSEKERFSSFSWKRIMDLPSWREARSEDEVCNALHSSTKEQSFKLLYFTFNSVSPGQTPSGLSFSIIRVVQPLCCSQIKWNESGPSSKALFRAKPVRRHPPSSPCHCHTQGYGEVLSLWKVSVQHWHSSTPPWVVTCNLAAKVD